MLFEHVMKAACEICRWPFECEDEAQLCEKFFWLGNHIIIRKGCVSLWILLYCLQQKRAGSPARSARKNCCASSMKPKRKTFRCGVLDARENT